MFLYEERRVHTARWNLAGTKKGEDKQKPCQIKNDAARGIYEGR